MEVVCLGLDDRRLLAARFAEHGNSQRRMRAALLEGGSTEAAERLEALRLVERHFGVDLGSLCHRFARREDAATHPLERGVLDFVACRRLRRDGAEELWVLVDRVRQVRELVEGDRLVLEPEP